MIVMHFLCLQSACTIGKIIHKKGGGKQMAELKNLKKVMKDQAWTVEMMAAKTKLAGRTIIKARNGESIAASTARAICKAVGLKIDELR